MGARAQDTRVPRAAGGRSPGLLGPLWGRGGSAPSPGLSRLLAPSGGAQGPGGSPQVSTGVGWGGAGWGGGDHPWVGGRPLRHAGVHEHVPSSGGAHTRVSPVHTHVTACARSAPRPRLLTPLVGGGQPLPPSPAAAPRARHGHIAPPPCPPPAHPRAEPPLPAAFAASGAAAAPRLVGLGPRDGNFLTLPQQQVGPPSPWDPPKPLGQPPRTPVTTPHPSP